MAAPYGAPYSDDMFSDVYQYLFTRDRTLQGVLPSTLSGFSGNLDCTYTNSAVTVLTGIGICDGKVYTNSASVELAFSGDGTYYVVLRKSWTSQTVRLAIITSGSFTQTDGATWDVVLHYFVRAGGVVSTYEDRRNFTVRPVTLYLPYTVYHSPSCLYNDLTDGDLLTFPETAGTTIGAYIVIPDTYSSGMKIEMSYEAVNNSGNAYFDCTLWEETSGSFLATKTVALTCAAGVQRTTLFEHPSDFSDNLRDSRGNTLRLTITRAPAHASDTNTDYVHFKGLIVSATGL